MNLKTVFDRRKKASDKTKGAVEIEIYFSRNTRKYVSTGVLVYDYQFSDHVINHDKALKLNRFITKKRKEIENALHSMEVEGVCNTLANFNAVFEPQKPLYSDFFDLFYNEIDKSGIRDTTKRQVMVAFEALERFGKIRSFDSITPANLELFDDFLRTENPHRVQTTIYGYHKRIKPYVLKAYRFGLIKDNPYNIFIAKNGRYKERKPLLQNEIDLILSTNFTPVLNKVRDMFIFQIYTGLSYADMQLFSKDEIVESGKIEYIDGRRYKTGTNFYTPILPPALKVLKKYNYELPTMTNERYNIYLHMIEQSLGIKKPLTSHVARHTFATTVALSPITYLSKLFQEC